MKKYVTLDFRGSDFIYWSICNETLYDSAESIAKTIMNPCLKFG